MATVRGLSTLELLKSTMGAYGNNVLTTGTTAGTWCAVAPIHGVSANVDLTITDGGTIDDYDIYGTIYGNITSITVNSGKVIAYKIG